MALLIVAGLCALVFGTDPIGRFILNDTGGDLETFFLGFAIAVLAALICAFICYKALKNKDESKQVGAYKVFRVLMIIAVIVFIIAFIKNCSGATTTGHLEQLPWGKHEWVAVTDSVHWNQLSFVGIAGLVMWAFIGCTAGAYISKET